MSNAQTKGKLKVMTDNPTPHTDDAFAALPIVLDEALEAMSEPYLADAEDCLEVRTVCKLIDEVLKAGTFRQQAMLRNEGLTCAWKPHENWNHGLGPVYGRLVPIMEALGSEDGMAGLSDPDTDELDLSFAMSFATRFLDNLDTTVRETY